MGSSLVKVPMPTSEGLLPDHVFSFFFGDCGRYVFAYAFKLRGNSRCRTARGYPYIWFTQRRIADTYKKCTREAWKACEEALRFFVGQASGKINLDLANVALFLILFSAGQYDGHGGALIQNALYGNFAVVEMHQLAHNGKSQARRAGQARTWFFGTIKRFKNFFLFIFGNYKTGLIFLCKGAQIWPIGAQGGFGEARLKRW